MLVLCSVLFPVIVSWLQHMHMGRRGGCHMLQGFLLGSHQAVLRLADCRIAIGWPSKSTVCAGLPRCCYSLVSI